MLEKEEKEKGKEEKEGKKGRKEIKGKGKGLDLYLLSLLSRLIQGLDEGKSRFGLIQFTNDLIEGVIPRVLGMKGREGKREGREGKREGREGRKKGKEWLIIFFYLT